MKIFAIRDENDKEHKNLAYLLYYKTEKLFYIELPDDADPWETPLLLSSLLKRGEKTINSYWSRIWVQQRIVPPDRQNIGRILKDNGLTEYDEYGLLMLAMGRCAQDDYYLVPMEDEDLPEDVRKRFLRRIEDVIPLPDYNILVFFRDGVIKKCSLFDYFESHKSFRILLTDESLFYFVKMQTGGYGVTWDINMMIDDSTLYHMGTDIPLSQDDFKSYVSNGIITSAESAEILGCSRQNIDDLTKRGKLRPIKTSGKTTLFLKSEIEKRNWY